MNAAHSAAGYSRLSLQLRGQRACRAVEAWLRTHDGRQWRLRFLRHGDGNALIVGIDDPRDRRVLARLVQRLDRSASVRWLRWERLPA